MSHLTNIGPARRAAYALAVFPLDVVERQTIRAMLPAGRRRNVGVTRHLNAVTKGDTSNGRTNTTSEAFGDALRRFAKHGWIDRGQQFVRIRDRGALLDYALDELGEIPAHFIAIDDALDRLRRELRQPTANDRLHAQRHRELKAIEELMRSQVQGVWWSGRGSVRFVTGRS